MAKYSQAQNKANQRYQLKAYDRVYVRVRKGKKEAYEKLAAMRGLSLTGLIISLLDNAAIASGLMDGIPDPDGLGTVPDPEDDADEMPE